MQSSGSAAWLEFDLAASFGLITLGQSHDRRGTRRLFQTLDNKENAVLDGAIKLIVTALWNAFAALLGAVFGLPRWLTESRADRLARYQNEADRRVLATASYDTVKNIVRKDGKERVRIVRDGENFGAVLESYNQRTQDWRPLQAVGAGCVYDSVESAETEAASAAPWLKLEARKA